jgi:ABC-type uncharacterized transport system YnjBCD substrate-binding protein
LTWSYGRPGQEPIKGVDVALVRDGHISLMLTFLDEVPAKLVTVSLPQQPRSVNPDRGTSGSA